jgi:hypothetical protein
MHVFGCTHAVVALADDNKVLGDAIQPFFNWCAQIIIVVYSATAATNKTYFARVKIGCLFRD